MATKAKTNKKQQIQQQEQKTEMQCILIENISTGNNPRQYFDDKFLLELAESIKQVGIIQPITVRTAKKANTYSIICGERRYRAAKIAGLEQMPAYIRECTDDEALDLALTENLQREDMSDIEIAEAIKIMLETKKMDMQAIAVKLGKSVKFVRDRNSLNNLIDSFKSMLLNEVINIGKAVFLAAYPQDLQELIYKDHFVNENYQYWVELSVRKMQTFLDNQYNSNLDKAEFDTTPCKDCLFNSSFGTLFADDTARCLKKQCFSEKSEAYRLNRFTAIIEDNPTLPICKYGYVSDWLNKAVEQGGFEISKEEAEYYPEEPEKPEEPKKEDFTDEETGELDAENFDEAISEFEQEQKDYEEAVQDYVKESLEIEAKLQSGEYKPCFILNGSNIDKGYIDTTVMSEEQGEETTEDTTESREIKKLHEKLKREQELKVEKTITDLKQQVFKGSVDFTKDAVKLEQDILFYFLLSDLTTEHKKALFGEDYPKDKEKFDFVVSMSPEQRTIIIRDYILSNLKQYAYNSYSVSSQLFLEFAKLHFEQETIDIERKHQEVFLRRKDKIEEKLKVLGVEIMEVIETEK